MHEAVLYLDIKLAGHTMVVESPHSSFLSFIFFLFPFPETKQIKNKIMIIKNNNNDNNYNNNNNDNNGNNNDT